MNRISRKDLEGFGLEFVSKHGDDTNYKAEMMDSKFSAEEDEVVIVMWNSDKGITHTYYDIQDVLEYLNRGDWIITHNYNDG